jgi:hypothetical protein
MSFSLLYKFVDEVTKNLLYINFQDTHQAQSPE